MWAAAWPRGQGVTFFIGAILREPLGNCGVSLHFPGTKGDLLPHKIMSSWAFSGYFVELVQPCVSHPNKGRRGFQMGQGGNHVSGRAKGRMVSLTECSRAGDPGLGSLPFNHHPGEQGLDRKRWLWLFPREVVGKGTQAGETWHLGGRGGAGKMGDGSGGPGRGGS